MRSTLCFFLLSGLAAAQSFQGTLRGRVTDPNAAVVPVAKITVTDEATGISRYTLTSDQGEYFFAAVTPGSYTMHAEAPGFKRMEQRGVVVSTQSAVTLDVKLELGQVTEQ